MIDTTMENRYFAAEVITVYRLSHGSRYFTREFLENREEYHGEIYRIIDKYESEIEHPALICFWPRNERKYGDKLK